MLTVRKAYLFLYNSAQWAGWLAILAGRATHLEGSLMSRQIVNCLYAFQGLAVMEVVHAFTGLVRASPVTTLVQVLSRLLLIGIHFSVREARFSTGLVPMLIAWGLVEVVRYLYLALNMFDMAPRWLLWLRYTLFYVLYPLGVYGEMKVMYDALPSLRESKILSVHLPNTWNFSFSFASFVWVLLYVIYIPGLYMQYTHMIKQRRKALGCTEVPAAKKAL